MSEKSERLKAMKRPDEFTLFVRNFFERLISNRRVFWSIVGVVGVVTGGVFVALSFEERGEQEGRNALFQARQVLTQEVEKLNAPSQAKEKNAANLAVSEVALFKKVNLKEKYPRSLEAFEKVSKEHAGSLVGFQAALTLGNLYFRHQDPEEAVTWYKKAIENAETPLNHAVAHLSLGFSYENLKKYEEAIASFNAAMNHGVASLKGEILLGMARCYEFTDKPKASEIYSRVLSELADTEYAKKAELYREKL